MTATRLMRPADFRAMAWKNGGGVTREIASRPSGSAAFDWRVSIASIERDGPFSGWHGVDRTFAVIDGIVVLSSPVGTRTLGPDDEPWTFDGGAAVDCRLPNGAARALNLMVRRGRAVGRVYRVHGAPREVGDAVAAVCYAVEGRSRCRYGAESSGAIDAGEALVVDAEGAPASFTVEPESRSARAIVATRSAS